MPTTKNTNTSVGILNKSCNTNTKNESQTICNKLKILNPNKKLQSRGKSPFGNTSETRQEPSIEEKEIINLKHETRISKHSPTNNSTRDNKKNAQMAPTLGGLATENTDLINVLTFI